MSHQTIVVLDFGSQFTQLIARRLRELSVYSEILPFDTPAAEIARRQPAGIILSGGPKSVSEEGAPKCEAAVFTAGRADPRHLLRDAADDGDARRGSGAGAASRVRPGEHPHHAERAAVRLGAGGAARLGEPRRLRRRRAGRLRGDGDERQRAGRGDGRAGSQNVRTPLPSGGCTY